VACLKRIVAFCVSQHLLQGVYDRGSKCSESVTQNTYFLWFMAKASRCGVCCPAGLQANRQLPQLATIEGVLEKAILKAGLITEANFGDFRCVLGVGMRPNLLAGLLECARGRRKIGWGQGSGCGLTGQTSRVTH
jgi:hypothetical protein